MVATGIVVPMIDDSVDPVLDVIVIDGQSNAAYWGWKTNDVCNAELMMEDWDPTPTERLMYYGTESSPLFFGPSLVQQTYDTTLESYGIHDMFGPGGWTVGGYGPAIAYGMSERSGNDVLIINVAISGAGVESLMPGSIGGDFATNVIKDAFSKVKGYVINPVAFIWAQGEADSQTTVEDYIEMFTSTQDMFADFGFMDCYVIKTRNGIGGNSVDALQQIIDTDDRVHMGSTLADSFSVDAGTMISDNVHYSQKGRLMIAEELGQAIELSEPQPTVLRTIAGLIPVVMIAGLIIGIGYKLFTRRYLQ